MTFRELVESVYREQNPLRAWRPIPFTDIDLAIITALEQWLPKARIMNDPPYTPGFPLKPGLTPEEQKKRDAYLIYPGATQCPDPFSDEMKELGQMREKNWAKALTKAMKVKLGMLPRKHPELTPKQKKDKEREYHRKRWLKRKGKK